MIDLSKGEIRVGQKATVTLSKTEVLFSRDSKDLNDLIVAKLGREAGQQYYFQRDPISGEFECISGPKGLREPKPEEWPSAQRGGK